MGLQMFVGASCQEGSETVETEGLFVKALIFWLIVMICN